MLIFCTTIYKLNSSYVILLIICHHELSKLTDYKLFPSESQSNHTYQNNFKKLALENIQTTTT